MDAHGGVVIRDATEADFDRAGEVMVTAYRQYDPVDSTDAAEREAWADYFVDIADVRSRLESSRLIVAERDGDIVGAVTFYPRGGAHYEGDTVSWPDDWPSFRLLAVHPSARGLRLGKALTEECMRRARELGASVIALHTTVVMDVARAMYERMGFVRVPEYDFYPIPGSDFVVMAYALKL
ncbi:MAG TPA: GNAT family N-acetyltransferase [Actinomycetota bacterium]|nr:GNAT family N-acetyltransferase [Actinomycetota bacterium]